MIMSYVSGDLVRIFEAGNNIAHGCNCHHNMGGGVAGQLASEFPYIPKVDKETAYASEAKLGTFSTAVMPGSYNQICFNLYTQFHPGADLRYGALVNSLIALNKWGENKIVPPLIYMPRIGCGIAGGDWEKVSALIDMFTPNLHIVIVDWAPVVV